MDKFNGVAFVKITSAYPAGALQKIQDAEICIFDVSYLDPFTISFSANRKDVRGIVKICEKRGDRVDIEGWTGYVFYLRSTLKRPVFLTGLLCWMILALWLPNKILFVTVSGADLLPDAYILECAANCGIQMGASSKEVRSEKTKNALLSKIPELRWAGVNTSGCIATICVQEKRKEDTFSPRPSVADIHSAQDAVVREITVQVGTPLCQPGQAVKKGQALISCYRDNGAILEFTGAGGEVYGDTKRYIQAITPLRAYKRTRVLSNKENFYVIIGKNLINFKKDSGILDGSCVKMYEAKECVLPGGFGLPIWFVKEQIISYDIEPVTLTDTDAAWLNDYAYRYLENSLVAGSILSEKTSTECTEEVYRIHGIYDCYEMIADYKYKGTTEINGENG